MEVQFYFNYSDTRVINKNIELGETITGELRQAISIMSPVIRFESNSVLRYNYAYIPDLQRYYAIEEISVTYDGLYDVAFSVDVLMSFRGHILQLPAIVDKQSESRNGDEYIDDGSLIADNVMFTTVYNFPVGFNDTPEIILITAG